MSKILWEVKFLFKNCVAHTVKSKESKDSVSEIQHHNSEPFHVTQEALTDRCTRCRW